MTYKEFDIRIRQFIPIYSYFLHSGDKITYCRYVFLDRSHQKAKMVPKRVLLRVAPGEPESKKGQFLEKLVLFLHFVLDLIITLHSSPKGTHAICKCLFQTASFISDIDFHL